ncbi:MAG: ExeA family protein [Massilia sp.]
MYLAHFGLNQSPFGITPNPEFFYSGNQRGAILEALTYAVTHGEGIVKVTGEVGSGKTMLCRMLEGMLPNHVLPIYLVNPTLARDQVGYAIAGELGIDAAGKRPDEVIRLLQNELIAKHTAGQQVVLLIEEAQAMPLDTLEEIRLFSNLETAHHKLLQIVLFGQPELDENLALPRMRQLKERITHSFKVPPLEPSLLPEFLMFRMRAAGYRGPDVFTKKAMTLLSSVSEGIVRRVSILADKALLAAFADNTHAITDKHVRAAILDSEFSASAKRQWRKRQLIAGGAVLLALLIAGAVAWSMRSAPAVATPASAAPASVQAPAGAMVAPKPAAAPAGEAGNARTRRALLGSKDWLRDQAAASYILQIALADTDQRKLERLLRRLDDEVGLDAVHVYPTRLNNEPRLGVLYAVYASRTEALAMKQQLAREWGYQPQLRTISGVREEVERTKADSLWPK